MKVTKMAVSANVASTRINLKSDVMEQILFISKCWHIYKLVGREHHADNENFLL